jgi:hypothetical protein
LALSIAEGLSGGGTRECYQLGEEEVTVELDPA